MSYSKHFDKIALIATALALVVTLLFINGAALGIEAVSNSLGYENRLFDNTKVHTIDIITDDWDGFIANAQNEEYSAVSLTIDGEKFNNVGIRGKGNTSLSTVSSMGSSRYSFKVEFDQYDSSVSYHGLDKLSLNNLIQDNTMMKDYLAYTMMAQFGVDAPLCSFVYITVNGEDWGLYLAVEGVEESFLQRNYGSDYGELYKPDSMDIGGGRGNGKGFDMEAFASQNGGSTNNDSDVTLTSFTIPNNFDTSQLPEDFNAEDFDLSRIPEGFNGEDFSKGGMGNMFGGMGSGDIKLQYIDDNTESYSNIWNNAKTDISNADKTRLINSLKTLSKYENTEDAVDIDEVLRYFVVHNYICNDDSYTGTMVHNYYLYEEDGLLSMIPWDYNLGYGTFGGGDATSTVNTPIDTPMEDRPMVNWIFENEEYTELYHEYFNEFISTVDTESIIYSAYELIAPYVKNDPTSFCTYEEFELGVETLIEFCDLRTESISLQLENGNTSETNTYTDASHITLSDMGTMGGMGGNMPQGDMQMPEGDFEMPEGGMQMPEGDFEMPEGGMQMPEGDFEMPQGGMQMPQGDFEMPQGGFGGKQPFS